MPEEKIESPYIEQPTFDWDAYKDKTLNVALKDILVILGGCSEQICYTGNKNRDEVNEIYNPIVNLVRDAMVRNSVGYNQVDILFDYLKQMIMLIENKLKKENEGHQKEIMSRILGAKNPMTDIFDVDFATFKNLADGVEKVRELTGGEVEDFFTIKKENKNE